MEYNMRNIFFAKSYIKPDGETIPRSFSKKSKLSISLDYAVLCSLFLLYPKVRTIEIYTETKLQTTCFYLIYSFF